MKTFLKALIAVVAGLLFSWVCMTLINLDQTISIVLTVFFTSAVFGLCDKLMTNKA